MDLGVGTSQKEKGFFGGLKKKKILLYDINGASGRFGIGPLHVIHAEDWPHGSLLPDRSNRPAYEGGSI